MRYFLLSLSPVLLGSLLLVSCNSSSSKTLTTSGQSNQHPIQAETTVADGARRVTIAEAQDLIKKGQAFVVDVRNQGAYDLGHIPGAKLIPATEILNHVDELPKDKTIITYCS